jgi:ATP-dependent DNA helicase DinG
VPEKCHSSCPQRLACRYILFLKQAQSPKTDIQVCNHNYIIADTKRRNDGLKPLIPNFQILVIDEGHKFLQAARQMYGVEFSSLTLPELTEDIKDVFFRPGIEQKTIRIMAKKLCDQNTRLFRCLTKKIEPDESEDDAERYKAILNFEAIRHLQNIRDIADSLIMAITPEQADSRSGRARILYELGKVTETAYGFSEYDELICWLEKPDGLEVFKSGMEMKLCAIPNNLDKILYKELWSKGFPVILTSGTLSAGAGASGKRDFTHIKRTLGLEYVGIRLSETSKPSPFNHRDNAMLYISEDMPFPDNKNPDYIKAVADEIEKLIYASCGHAAVLFTSHDALGRVYSILKRRGLPYPLFRLERSDVNAIDKFKHSGNGVLFASGSMWEGVDIPGDALSMLIIVKLPFSVPDPVSEYERTLYPNFLSYKNRFIVPDMLIKLRQGFGRLLRREGDTGVVAILDSRVNKNGIYRSRVLTALPDCVSTSYIDDVEDFIKAAKAPEYFL